MKITYANKRIQKLCTSEKAMKKERPDIAAKLRLRMVALEAAPALRDLLSDDPLGKWHRLVGDRDGQWAGKVSSNERLVVRPIHSCGTLEELLACEEVVIEVIEVVDYHN